jgi:WD40 repeat protein
MTALSSPDELVSLIGAEPTAALRRWAELRNSTVSRAIPTWVAAGHTGARLAAVVVHRKAPAPPRPRKLIVKACPPGHYSREAIRHHEAMQSSPVHFAQDHLVELEGDPIPLEGGGVLLLQGIAGGSLLRCRPMSELSGTELVSAARAVVRGVVNDWNDNSFEISTSTAAAFLRQEFRGAFADAGSLRRLADAAGLLDMRAGWVETAEDGPDQPLPNPILLAADSSIASDCSLQYASGRMHGDLHEDNVLVPRSERGVLQADRFRLVDLSTFEHAAPLSRDPATLMVSLVARRVPALPEPQREELLTYLVTPSREATNRMPPELKRLVDAVRYAGPEGLTDAGFTDNWREQSLISLQAMALLFLTFEDIPPDTRWWLFRLAARAGAAFLRSRGRWTPDAPKRVDSSLIVSRSTAATSRPAKIATPTDPRPRPALLPRPAVDDGYRRSLFIVATDAYEADSGLPPVDDLDAGLSLVVDSFTALGYEWSTDAIARNAPPEALRSQLADWFADKGPQDILALYVTGNAERLDPAVTGLAAPHLVLHTTRSRAGHARGTLSIEALLEGVYGRAPEERIRQLMLVLDMHVADPGIGATSQELGAALDPLRPADSNLPAGAHVILVTRSRWDAPSWRFMACWQAAVRAPDLAPREQRYLDLGRLADRVRGTLGGEQALQTVSLHQRGPDNHCLPNPRHHLAGIDPAEMEQWWEPTARAVPLGSGAVRTRPSATGPLLWFFSGRRRLNREIVHWLSSPSEPVLVLTGPPGSGKSTVLARTVALTAPDVRASLSDNPDALLGEASPPEDFRFAATIWAHRLGVDQVAARIRAALGISADDRLDQLPALPPSAGAGEVPSVIAVDALDEAADPHRLVAEVLRPLAQAAHRGGPRLLVATRNQPVGHDPDDPRATRTDLLTPLISEGGSVVQVDSVDWLETGDIAEYCDRLLAVPVNDLGRRNPYADAPVQRRVLARSIESRARHSFLIAAHVARRHTLDADLADPLDPAWAAQFPEQIGQAMRQEVEAVFGPVEAARQLALLRPLAFAEGVGLSREAPQSQDLWALLATTLDPQGRRFTPDDVDRLLAHRVATHLVARIDAHGTTAYRFHHEALAESFVTPGEDRAAHAAITTSLLNTLDNGVARDWSSATPYVARALPWHAGRARMLGRLADDPGTFMQCDPNRLHAALVTAPEPRLGALSHLLRPYLHRLRVIPPDERAFLLSLVAESMGRSALAGRLAEATGMPVGIRRVRVRHEALREAMVDGASVDALVAARARDGSPLLFIGNGRFIDVRDPDSGAMVETFLSGLAEITAMQSYIDGDGFPVVVAAGPDGARVFDVTTRAVRAQMVADLGRGIALGHYTDGSVFLAGWTDDQVRVWNPTTDTDPLALPVRWEPGRQPITSVVVVRNAAGSDLLAVAAGGRVRLWDSATWQQVDTLELGDAINIQLASLQPTRRDGQLLIATGLSDRSALLWRSSRGVHDWPLPDVPACSATWSDPSGDKIVLGYVTGAVELWDGDEKAQPKRLQESGMSVQEVIIGPDDAAAPAVVAIEVTGQIRLWNLDDPSRGSTLSGSFPHSLTMGSLRDGGRYLSVGRNNGADLWRLDEVRDALEEDGLHNNDAQRIVLLDRGSPSRFVTAGDDGRLRVWDEVDGRPRRSLAIPTGYPSDLTAWRTNGGEERVAVTAAHLLRIYDASSGELRLERELSAPGRMSYLDLPGGGLLAVADRQQVHVVDTATGDVRSLLVPDRRPGTEESRTEAARNVLALCWAPSAGPGQALVRRYPGWDAGELGARPRGVSAGVQVGDRRHGRRGRFAPVPNRRGHRPGAGRQHQRSFARLRGAPGLTDPRPDEG